MVIIRSGAIAREVEPSGKCKVAAAPDNGRSNEPWQWRLTVGEHPMKEAMLNGQSLTLRNLKSGHERILELSTEKNLVSGEMHTETFTSQSEMSRNEGELVVIYLNSGELALDNHTLGAGDAVVVSGNEHYKVKTKSLTNEVDGAIIRLAPATEIGLGWIP